MGSFFDNIQVHIGARDPEALRQIIAATVRHLAVAGPYVELDDPTSEPDHEILIAPADDTSWIAVYGALAEGPDEESRLRAAAALSAAVEGRVVTVMVYDSDVLEMRRYTEGDLVDAYSSDPDYFGIFDTGDADDRESLSDAARHHRLCRRRHRRAARWSTGDPGTLANGPARAGIAGAAARPAAPGRGLT